jgi:hypothetical protein
MSAVQYDLDEEMATLMEELEGQRNREKEINLLAANERIQKIGDYCRTRRIFIEHETEVRERYTPEEYSAKQLMTVMMIKIIQAPPIFAKVTATLFMPLVAEYLRAEAATKSSEEKEETTR